ncbi:MAG: hypothetical protein JST38_01115 [Bacteroidetes bacterium]|nr:hypothetical protein [Bacteroidota bacterium]MBS1939464.1 hypothetical protein [Bacteroidota bacterium]
MKNAIAFLFGLLLAAPAWACEACERQQPKLLKGITHGTGPQSGWDMPIIYVSIAIVLVTLFFALKYLIKPNEDGADHIKRAIFQTPTPDHGR